MKIIIAPDKFKGSLSGQEVASAMAEGAKLARPDAIIDICPVADGGEGFGDAILLGARACEREISTVLGPLGELIDAAWGVTLDEQGSADAGVIEMAAASGLIHVPMELRNPANTTTYGTGQLVVAAIERGARHVILGIGGSATTDGGTGAAQAAGVRFYDAKGKLLGNPITGGMLASIARIDMERVHPKLRSTRFTVACDVTNPLTGPDGAAAVYGPQKGATPSQVVELDAGLAHLADLIRKQVGVDVERIPGAGAAGGLGAGAVAFFGAVIRPGAGMVLDAVGFEERIKGCDLCLTGEGRLDGQTLSGKALHAVVEAAGRHGVPVFAIVGSAQDGAEKMPGLKGVRVIGKGLTVEESMRRARELLVRVTGEVVGAC